MSNNMRSNFGSLVFGDKAITLLSTLILMFVSYTSVATSANRALPMAPPGIEVGQPNDSLLPSKGGTTLPLDKSSRTLEFDNKMPNGKPKNKVVHPESPIIDIVVALDRSKLRKVSERVISPKPPKLDERNSLLEKIRSKSFNLRPTAATRPIMEGPKTNLRVAAILDKANSIRQVFLSLTRTAGKIFVKLNSRLNKCGVISPRFDVGVKEIESWTVRLLPSRQDLLSATDAYGFWLSILKSTWSQWKWIAT
ncbi:hypothetical protein HN51_062871 [Arachis hypogaea]